MLVGLRPDGRPRRGIGGQSCQVKISTKLYTSVFGGSPPWAWLAKGQLEARLRADLPQAISNPATESYGFWEPDHSMQLLLIILGCLSRLVPSGVKTVRRGVMSLRLREASFFPKADLEPPGSPFVGWLKIWPVLGAFWKPLDCHEYFPVADCRDGVGGRIPVPVTSRVRCSALGRRKPVATRRF